MNEGYSEKQITFALRQSINGIPVVQFRRKMGVSEATFYWWKRRFEGNDVAELHRLRQLEEENRKPKQLVGDLSWKKGTTARGNSRIRYGSGFLVSALGRKRQFKHGRIES